MLALPENRLLRCVFLLVRRYLRHHVGTQSAALAFYLLFMLFPFLIFVSALIGLLELDTAAVVTALAEFLPREVTALAEMYLRHVGENPSPRLLTFGLVFSVWFPARAARTLMRAVRTAYHLGSPRRTLLPALKAVVYAVLLIAAIALTLTLLTVSDRLLGAAAARQPLLAAAAGLWGWLRLLLAAVVGFFALFALYALSQDGRCPWRALWPGTMAALGAWLTLSWLYGWYVAHIAHYSLLYGSIGAIIVLLIWLYMTAVVLIMGAELNGVLLGLRQEKNAC